MDKVRWTQQMELGIPELDEAHRALVNTMTELADLPDAQFGAGLIAFVGALEEDFRCEEQAMEAIDFPALKSHREQHARVLSALHHVVPELTRGEFESARKAVDLLPHWFVLHLATQDAALAAAMELSAQEGPAAPENAAPPR